MHKEECGYCGTTKSRYQMKQGWTNAYYCCEQCERIHVKQVHDSMSGGRSNSLPRHVAEQIERRWAGQS